MAGVYTVPDFGPSDLLTSEKEGVRRIKADINPEIIDIFNQVKTVEYTPIIENKPGTGYSFLRDKISDPTKLNLVEGELELDGTDQLRACYTRKYGRYLPGLVAQAGIRARMLNPNVGTYRFGYGNGLGNRVGMEVIDGQYRTYVESGGVRWYSANRSQWLDRLDGEGPSGLNVPDLNGTTLRMKFGHYGGLSILFYLAIGRRIGGDIEVLIDSSGPKANGITLEQPDLPIFAETNSKLYIGGRQFGIFGRYRPQFRVTSSGRVTKNNVGTTFVPVVSFRIKADPRWQSVAAELVAARATSTANGQYRVIIDGTLTAGGSPLVSGDWGNVPGVDPNETAVEMNTTATTISGGYKIEDGLVTGGVGNQQGTPGSDLADINLPRNTVVTLAVAADSGTTSTFRTILKVKEEH